MTRSIRIAVLLVLVVMLLGATERDREREVCEDACRSQGEQCVEQCADYHDPIECDAQCRESREDCLRECGR